MSLADDDLRHALRLLDAAVRRQEARVKEAVASEHPPQLAAAARESLARLQDEAARLRDLLAGTRH